jgi:hypothetical protein
MRAVALSDKTVQAKIEKGFVPLKVVIPHGAKEFDLDWPAMATWRVVYKLGGGEKNGGLTGCSVVSTDTQVELANTGSAFVWEMFDSTAYDPTKFAAMLDRGLERAEKEKAIRTDPKLTAAERAKRLTAFRKEVGRQVGEEGRMRGKPTGYSDLHSLELFGLTGDLFARPPKTPGAKKDR